VVLFAKHFFGPGPVFGYTIVAIPKSIFHKEDGCMVSRVFVQYRLEAL
jgi:hypothetical protein